LLIGDRGLTFPKQNITIIKIGIGFRIYDDSGVYYDFLDTETTTTITSSTSGFYTPAYISSWNLTRIVTNDLTDAINFQYITYNHPLSIGYAATETYKNDNYQSATGNPVWRVGNYPSGSIAAKRLIGITSKTTRVEFIPESIPRQDIGGTSYGLKEIAIYNQPNNSLIKKIKLTHSYFNNVTQASKLKLDAVNIWGYKTNTINNVTIIDSSYNSYSFQYKNETSDFPIQTKGIDKWGYYNGANNNVMLFDNSAPVQKPMIQQAANRSINPATIDFGILSKMVYPTGGFSTFEYENNTIQNPSIPFILINQLSSLTTPYIGGSNNALDSSVKVASFVINATQTIKVKYGRTLDAIFYSPSGVPNSINQHRIFKLFKSNYIDDNSPTPPPTVIFISEKLGKPQLEDSVTLSLVPGSYYYYVTCDQQSLTAYAYFNYFTQSVEPYPGDSGPGVRIKLIASFDKLSSTTASLIKKYDYANGGKVNSYNEWVVNSILHHQWCEFTETVCSSSQSSSLSSLLANQFYYPTVTEINNSIVGMGKTVYEYQSGSNFDAFGVNLIAQREYNDIGNLLREVKNTYTEKTYGQFSGFDFNISDVVDLNPCPNLSNFLPQLHGAGGFDTIARNVLYRTTPYTLNSKFQFLDKAEETTYGQNTTTTPMLITTNYFYDNQAVFKPTKIVSKKGSGETVTSYFKYPLDYYYNLCSNWKTIDDNYFIARNNLYNNYWTCTSARLNAAGPYATNPPNAPTPTLLNILRAWPCEKNYVNDYLPIKSTMLSGIYNLRTCYDPMFQTPANAGTIVLQKNYVETPLEQIMTINKNGIEYLQSATKTEYNSYLVNNSYNSTPKTIYQTTLLPTSVLKSDFLANPTNYYKPRVDFKYNSKGNITEQSKLNDTKETYIWDYNDQNATAKIINADSINVAATSFESNGTGKFNFTGTSTIDANSITGNKTYALNTGNITKTSLDAAKTYIVSYWSDNGVKTISGATLTNTGRSLNGFTYYEHKVVNPAAGTITISGIGKIDELRLYPDAAQMMTYTYESLIGITSQCDANNKITYYEYDALSRLILIRDQDNKILKKICYNYAGQVEDCPLINNITPRWVATGNTRCQPCPANSLYNNGIKEREEKDINPNSPTYSNPPRWVIDPTGTCASPQNWLATGVTRCQPCAANPTYNSGVKEREEKDMNPCSSAGTGNTTRWVIDPTGTCPTTPEYQTTGVQYCQQVGNINTGSLVQETANANPCAGAIGQPGPPIIIPNYGPCIPCSVPCTSPQYMCINGTCVLGVLKVIKVRRISKLIWECTKAYCFPVGIGAIDTIVYTIGPSTYTEVTTGTTPCTVECN
jgi:YD repeat-containing protein